ncbi:unnamed protein product [Orchesella dallaii]|uniref:Methyl farnesoate epoxidase n=1 Tax=Orchesella dallaii TaxID=48710 RepID=A0ABP1QQ66_9HEXA
MAFQVYVIAFVITILFYFRYKSNRKRKINLPGPWGLPILGNVHQIDSRFYKKFVEWSQKYGPMYRVKLGGDEVVVVSDAKIAKEMYSADIFTGRMTLDGVSLYETEPHLGLVNSFGEPWEQLRRFTLRQLRDFGFGKSSMETLIMNEVTEFIDGLDASNGKSIDNIQHRFSVAVVNALWTIVSGERYSHQDPKLSHLTSQVTKSFDAATNTGGLILFAPWVKHILPQLSGYNFIRTVMDQLREFMIKTVETHKPTFVSGNSPRHFIDVFLREISSTQDPTSSFYKDVGEKQLVACISDLFFAGFDPTSKTLSWAFLYLTKWPEVQKSFKKEINSVTGGNQRAVTIADRQNMPYTRALIEEVLRLSSL